MINCRFRKETYFIKKDGKRIDYSKCIRDGKSCREYDMYGYDCYENEQ
jgi:hypothetical protein